MHSEQLARSFRHAEIATQRVISFQLTTFPDPIQHPNSLAQRLEEAQKEIQQDSVTFSLDMGLVDQAMCLRKIVIKTG